MEFWKAQPGAPGKAWRCVFNGGSGEFCRWTKLPKIVEFWDQFEEYLIFGTWWKFNSKFWMYGTNGVEKGEFGKGILRATYPPTEVCS